MDTKNIPSTPPLGKGITIFTLIIIFLIVAVSYLAYPPPPKYANINFDTLANETVVKVNPQHMTFEDLYPHEES